MCCREAVRRRRWFRCCRQRRSCRAVAGDAQTPWSETASPSRAGISRASCSARPGRRANGTAAVRCDTCPNSRWWCGNVCCDAASSSSACSHRPGTHSTFSSHTAFISGYRKFLSFSVIIKIITIILSVLSHRWSGDKKLSVGFAGSDDLTGILHALQHQLSPSPPSSLAPKYPALRHSDTGLARLSRKIRH